jgi:hypothetical protein
MKNEIVKKGVSDVGPIGKNVLNVLRENWKEMEREVDKTVLDDDGVARIKKVVIKVASPNKARNAGKPAELFYRFAGLIKDEEDKERINKIIRAGVFCVDRALRVFEVAPKIAVDRKIKPTNFDQAKELNSPSIASMVMYKGEQKTIDLIFYMLEGLVKKFGSRNDLTEEDQLELAEDIVTQFKMLKIAEIKMAFVLGMRKKKVFKLDYPTVISWLAEIEEERHHWASNKALNEHLSEVSHEKQRREREVKRMEPGDQAIKEYLKGMGKDRSNG